MGNEASSQGDMRAMVQSTYLLEYWRGRETRTRNVASTKPVVAQPMTRQIWYADSTRQPV